MEDENNLDNRPVVTRRPPRRTRALLITTAGLAVTLMSTTGCTPQERPAETQTVVTAAEAAEVVAVVDGDTIDVKTSTGESRVRIIGIDTPEIGRDGAAGDCYAIEARNFLDELRCNHGGRGEWPCVLRRGHEETQHEHPSEMHLVV